MPQQDEKQTGDSIHGARLVRGAGAGPLTALVVDEDDDLRVYLRRCLKQFGPLFGPVLEVSSGSEALLVARTNDVDMLISGVHLSQPGTTALFNAIRSDPTTASVVILLVADDDVEADRSLDSPSALADAVLVAPFNAAVFADCLAGLLRSG